MGYLHVFAQCNKTVKDKKKNLKLRNIELVIAFRKCLCHNLGPSGFLNHSAVKWYHISKIRFDLMRGSRGATQRMPSNLTQNHSMERTYKELGSCAADCGCRKKFQKNILSPKIFFRKKYFVTEKNIFRKKYVTLRGPNKNGNIYQA